MLPSPATSPDSYDIFIYKTLEPETRISFCLSPYSAESQRADTSLTLGFSGRLARQDDVWEAAEEASILCPFWRDQRKAQGGKPRLTHTFHKGNPVPATPSFLQSPCSQVETHLRLKPGKPFSICSYQLGFSFSWVFRQF